MQSRIPALLAAILVVLSGCAASDEPTDLPATSATSSGAAMAGNETGSLFAADGSAELPAWNIGDWWDYEVQYASGESYSAKIVVHGQDAGNYYLTSDSIELLQRSAFTHYPTFGAVKKTTLDHVIHGVDVPFLKFPMRNQSWEAEYRDFTGAFSSELMPLATTKGQVQGFRTTMTNAADGSFRMVNGWSPVTKYFTMFLWDFDGVAPHDVQFTLKDWGANYTGPVPVLEVTEGVHRMFPTFALAAPTGAPPAPGPDNRAAFNVPGGNDLLVGMFAGAGGPGDFEMNVYGAGGRYANYPWRPTAAAGHFEWDLMTDFPAGEGMLVGTGAAQGSAFLFLEAYAIRTLTVEV